MNQATNTEVTTEQTTTVEVTTAANEAAKAEAKAPKAPSKKTQAQAIFDAKMADRKAGLFPTNKEFRAAVLRAMESELGVSTASAATMYNAAKVAAEAADPTVGLGRDPKKEKAPSANAGKRGRPAGSKNKPKTEEAATPEATDTPVEAAPVTETTLDLSAVANTEAPVEAAPEAADAA